MFGKMLVCLAVLAGIAGAEERTTASKTVFWSDAAVLVSMDTVHFQGRWIIGRDVNQRFGANAFFVMDNADPSIYVGPSMRLASGAHAGLGFRLSKVRNPFANIGIWFEMKQGGPYPLDALALVDDDGLDIDCTVEVHRAVGVGLTVRDADDIGPRLEWRLGMVRLWASPLYNWIDQGMGGAAALIVTLP